jgi:hypothetical protein
MHHREPSGPRQDHAEGWRTLYFALRPRRPGDLPAFDGPRFALPSEAGLAACRGSGRVSGLAMVLGCEAATDSGPVLTGGTGFSNSSGSSAAHAGFWAVAFWRSSIHRPPKRGSAKQPGQSMRVVPRHAHPSSPLVRRQS